MPLHIGAYIVYGRRIIRRRVHRLMCASPINLVNIKYLVRFTMLSKQRYSQRLVENGGEIAVRTISQILLPSLIVFSVCSSVFCMANLAVTLSGFYER